MIARPRWSVILVSLAKCQTSTVSPPALQWRVTQYSGWISQRIQMSQKISTKNEILSNVWHLLKRYCCCFKSPKNKTSNILTKKEHIPFGCTSTLFLGRANKQRKCCEKFPRDKQNLVILLLFNVDFCKRGFCQYCNCVPQIPFEPQCFLKVRIALNALNLKCFLKC